MQKQKNYKTISIPKSNDLRLDDLDNNDIFGLEERNLHKDRIELNRILNHDEENFQFDIQYIIFGFSRIQSIITAFRAMGYASKDIMKILGIHNRKYYKEFGNLRKDIKKEKIL